MADRITPRPPPELRARVQVVTGRDDAAPVTSERFIQGVSEDDLIAGRPDWARVGVELVTSVAPYEEAKIRILNASHSCIAWADPVAALCTDAGLWGDVAGDAADRRRAACQPAHHTPRRREGARADVGTVALCRGPGSAMRSRAMSMPISIPLAAT